MKNPARIMIPFLVLSACSTAPKDRTIVFDGIENARELGGLVMQDGRTIRAGRLVRSGELSAASDRDVSVLKERFALSDVFDFRFEQERSRKPDREMDDVPASLWRIPPRRPGCRRWRALALLPGQGPLRMGVGVRPGRVGRQPRALLRDVYRKRSGPAE